MSQTILRIDASAQAEGSVSRQLADRLVARLGGPVTRRDLAGGLPLIDADWIAARSVAPADRTPEQAALMALSDRLVAELQAADTVVIATPIYNFSIPAVLKAWIDLVARPGVTFRYTGQGPEGLLRGKRVIVAVASGGTGIGSEIDFATGYLRHMFGFIGIDDVAFVGATGLAIDAGASLGAAEKAIDALPLAA